MDRRRWRRRRGALSPAWRSDRARVERVAGRLAQPIRTGSQRSTGAFWTRLRGALIGAEVALTVVLVVSAGLLIKSLYTLSEVRPGFDSRQILTVRISPNSSFCTQRPRVHRALRPAAAGRARNPRRRRAAVASAIPLDAEQPDLAVDVEGHPKTVDHPAPMLWAGAVSAGYIRMMRIPLLTGRDLSEADGAKSAAVLLISASTAKTFLARRESDRQAHQGHGRTQWRTVVGVVGDVRQYSLSKAMPTLYKARSTCLTRSRVREEARSPRR